MADPSPQASPAPPENRPFWRDSGCLTALAALIAAVIPITAAVNGFFSLQLEKEKFMSELHLKYVDRALDTSKDPTYRESFLKFLAEVTPVSDLLHDWAKRQLKDVDEVGKLRAEMVRLNAGVREISDNLAQEKERRSNDKKRASRLESDLQKKAFEALSERRSLEEKLRNAELKAGYSPPVPSHSSPSGRGNLVQGGTGPEIFYAEVRPSVRGIISEIVVSGKNFGDKSGHVYEVHGGGSSQGPLLNIISWRDTEIRARLEGGLPPSWTGLPPIYIGLTTEDLRYAEPVLLSQFGGF